MRPALRLLPLPLCIAFSLAGAVFGMSEEAIALTLLLAPALTRAGYDAVTAVLVCYGASQIGFATSWMNPFSVIIAQSIAGLPPMSGLGLRIAVWTRGEAVEHALELVHIVIHARAQHGLGDRGAVRVRGQSEQLV